MKPSDNCTKLVKHFEGIHDGDLSTIGLQPKMCPAGIWTVGYGRALFVNGKYLKGERDKEAAYKMYPSLTEEEAERMLADDLATFSKAVNSIVENLNLKQYQFDSLVSFAYNCGVGAIYDRVHNRDMAVLRAVKSKDPKQIDYAFGLWIHGGGRVLPGLVARRKCEANFYNTGILKF